MKNEKRVDWRMIVKIVIAIATAIVSAVGAQEIGMLE